MSESVAYQPICIIDCETLGIEEADPIWEVSAALIHPDGTILDCADMLVVHYPNDDWIDKRPEAMQADYAARYSSRHAWLPSQAAKRIQAITDGAIVAGSNPMFDMIRLARLLHRSAYLPKWHYHPMDIPDLVHGYLRGRGITVEQPWKSDRLSAAAGINPDDYQRHTAGGDVAWCLDMYRTVIGQPDVRDGAA